MSFTESVEEIVRENHNGLLSAHPTWARVPLGEVCSILNGFPFESSQFRPDQGFPLIRIRDVRGTDTAVRFDGRFDKAYVVQPGDLLVGMDGDFKCALWRGAPALLNQRVCKASPDERFYARRFLVTVLQGYLDAINAETSSITVKHLSSRTLAEIPLPLPPRQEQRLIVAALDSYFSRLDAAVASLERVQRNLKRYRASVLKAAVEGRLVPTEAELARQEGRTYEPASVLLARILAERRRRWIENATKSGRANAAKAYPEAAPPDTTDLPELPVGWCWASADQLGDVTGGVTKNAQRTSLPLQVPYLRVANVYADELRLDEIKEIGVTEGEARRTTLERGDLLVVEGNGSVDQIGRVALWDGSIDGCVHQNHLIRVRFLEPALARWCLHWLLSPAGRREIVRAASSTSGLHTLSMSKVSALPIPLCPLDELRRASAEIDRLLSLAAAAGEEARHSLGRSRRLRQAILKWAFEGRLVDQDPTDEPASVLLERIRGEREAVAGDGRPRAGRSKTPRARGPRRGAPARSKNA